MKRMNCYFLLLVARTMCFAVSCTEKSSRIRSYSRHKPGKRPISTGKFRTTSLLRRHRISTATHSSYILARFKGGLFNGDYEEYIYNKLKAKSSYKEGGRTEPAEKYDVEGRVTKENPRKSGKLDGAHRTFYTKEKLEKERFYKEGMKNGKDVYYEFNGALAGT